MKKRASGWSALLAVVSSILLLSSARPGAAQATAVKDAVVLGPVQEVALVEDFAADRAPLWKPRSGSNVAYTVKTGEELPGVANTLMTLTVGKKDPADRVAGNNWFQVVRDDFPAGTVPANADGLRFLIGSRKEVQWWVQAILTLDGGESYSHVVADHPFPAGRILEYAIPFERFKDKDGKVLTPAEATKIRGITFTLGSAGTTLYVDRISAYRQERFTSWLDFTTSEPETNLFERDGRVQLVFTTGGTPPEKAKGFRYEVRDYDGKIAGGGSVPLTGAPRYTVDATPKTHGYYEVQTFWTDTAGKDLEKRSCLRAEGSLPAGYGTFSVAPLTVAQNIARFRKFGASAYFGMHGDFLGLADHIGLTWRFGYRQWKWQEPNGKPDRSAGPAPWVAELTKDAPQPEYRFHILPFRGNMGGEVPDWAKNKAGTMPPFANWDDYQAMLRDYAKAEKLLYPHQKPRLYGGAWEVNLNMQPYVSQQPEHTPADVVELFRRTREAIKSEDPDAWILGPCPSVLDTRWLETIFAAGVLKYLDGIETHAYLQSVFNPEENDFPGKLAKINELVRHYNGGKTLPIYVTEAGQPGVLGADIVPKSQAQRMVRTAIICKGEGVRVFLPFYGIDFDRSGYWGFFYNKDIDAPSGPWGTKRVSPKPMVNAVAACALALEGTKPKARIATLGSDVWAYAFERGGETVTAVWTTGTPKTVSLPVGKASSVKVMDFMGHESKAAPAKGALRLPISQSPVYVIAAR